MGFKSSKNTRNVNHSNEEYEVDDIIFPTKNVFKTIKSINRKLRLLYSPAPTNSLWPTINYSPVRDDDEEFNAILDRVEERIDRFNEKVEIIETGDAAFNKKFLGIVNFLYEASDFEDNTENDLSKKTAENIKKRFISIAHKFWEAGVCPMEF